MSRVRTAAKIAVGTVLVYTLGVSAVIVWVREREDRMRAAAWAAHRG